MLLAGQSPFQTHHPRHTHSSSLKASRQPHRVEQQRRRSDALWVLLPRLGATYTSPLAMTEDVTYTHPLLTPVLAGRTPLCWDHTPGQGTQLHRSSPRTTGSVQQQHSTAVLTLLSGVVRSQLRTFLGVPSEKIRIKKKIFFVITFSDTALFPGKSLGHDYILKNKKHSKNRGRTSYCHPRASL